MEPFIFFIVMVGMTCLALVGFYFSKLRRDALTKYAQSVGLQFVHKTDSYLSTQYSEFSCLQKGRRRRAYNFLLGDWKGFQMQGFDFCYTTGSGKNKKTHHLSAVILTLPYTLDHLSIRPEGLFDKVTAFLGYEDINFESAEFSRQFYVTAKNKQWAYDVLHARAIEYLLAQPRFSLEIHGRDLIIYNNKKFTPHQFGHAADLATGLLKLLPDYVTRDLIHRNQSLATDAY